eukprot:TRINITY_DN61041_c0_g1_i1.p1 TRINITY_DN61041_c0_g1~~TRINITY_DN61041_c0_g1_i1.p1  ORF type:complete len:362 (+),score=68.10 TRINITY_DN61041_c0_g1_i1:186-1271(+)
MTQWSRAAPLYPGKDSRTFAITLEPLAPSSPTPAEDVDIGRGASKKQSRKVPIGIIPPESWDPKRRGDRPQKTYVLTVDPHGSPRSARKKCLMPALSPDPAAGSPADSLLEAEQRAAFRAQRQERFKLERVFPVLVKPQLLPEWGGDHSSGGEEKKEKVLTARRGTVVSLQRQRDRLKESEERQKRSQDAAGRWNPSGRATALNSRKDPAPLDTLQDEELDVLKQQAKEPPPLVARPSLVAVGTGNEVSTTARRGSLRPGQSSLTAEVRQKGRELVQEMSKRVSQRHSLLRKDFDYADFQHRIKMAGIKERMKEAELRGEGKGDGEDDEEKDVLQLMRKRISIMVSEPVLVADDDNDGNNE